MRALIIVDVQNDFCEGGSLPVEGGAAVAAAISGYVKGAGYDHVVATRDHHVDPGSHFSDDPDFAQSWPPHCRAGTAGASFHPELDVSAVEAVFSKGEYSAGYSGFEGTETGGATLGEWLSSHEVDEVDVAGIATELCVRATARDAATAGLRTRLLIDLCRGVDPEAVEKSLQELRDAGVEVVA